MKLNNHQKGVLLILLSALFFGANSIATKSIPNIPAFERIFFMNLVAACIMLTRITKDVKFEILGSWKLLSVRALLGFLSTLTYFYSIINLPLADATLLNKTSPFFVTFFSVVWLKEKVKSTEIVAMIIAGIGAILVINPSFDFSILPALIGILSGATAGGAYTIVRRLKDRINPNNIVFYFMTFSLILSTPFMLVSGFVMPTWIDMLTLIFLGFAISMGQIAMSFAYKYEEASKISIYSYFQIILSLVFGLILFAEIPTWTTLLGGGIIFISGYINYRVNLKRMTITSPVPVE